MERLGRPNFPQREFFGARDDNDSVFYISEILHRVL